jgi:hypothetical protein
MDVVANNKDEVLRRRKPMETFDCRITFRDIDHRNEPKTSRLAGLAIPNQFDFINSAERLKKSPWCAFCYVKGKISRRKASWR